MVATQEKCRLCNLFKPIIGFLVLLFVCPGYSLGNDNLLKIVDVAVNSGKLTGDVSLMWGIPDATAYVGHFFNYTIPSDAFKGQSLQYKITEAGKDVLPSWLTFDPKKQLLQGVPLPSEIGQHYIEVVATDKNNAQAKDIFSIEVQGERMSQPSTTLTFQREGPQTVRCKREQSETVVTIMLDSNLDKLSAHERLNVMNRFSGYLNLAEEMLKMVPVAGKSLNDASALVAGPGNTNDPKEPGAFVSWRVGCGKVEADHMPILQQIETEAQSGKLAEALKHPIVGWHVTNSRFQEHKRRKRAIRATPLATVGVQPTIPVPPPKETIIMTKPGDDMTRPVLSMASPTFSIQPTETTPMMKTTSPDGKPTKPIPVKPTEGLQPSIPVPEPTDMDKTVPLPEETIHIHPTKTDTHGKPTDRPAVPGCITDQPPEVSSPLGRLEFKAGEFTKFKIPADTFYDCEVGNTRDLKLDMLINHTVQIPSGYWLSFERKKQVIKAFPSLSDQGVHKFTLLARKGSGSLLVTHSFKIKVTGGKAKELEKINHEMSITLDMDYDEFMSNVDNRIEFVNKLSKLFGDKNADSIQLTKLERGSVVISWTNTSMSGSDCPVDDLKAMADKLMNEDGTIKEEAARALRPYKLTQAGLAPQGACERVDAFPRRSSPIGEPAPDQTDAPKPTGGDAEDTTKPADDTSSENVLTGSAKTGDDIWITTVVPAVVIVAILLIALLVACILYRKKRKGKMSLEDKHTFVNKGVPVILPDELEENEKQSESCKPLIMPEEKPPITSPEYRAGSSEASTPPANHRNVMADDQYNMEVLSPLYQPPPPVQSSGGNRQPRPYVQPSYKPTTYVPP
ncbi:dystroglycan 1 [Patella vulgata]|uniref:dystroglycan 1 n=1 Tax=Patella vulgata TaxID=6465 RepID=UPI00217F6EAB|nr:dystroglycan 1 [Patella vulgata]XP_050412906.1 dystroglycan 1 [Patella vulgata]XP_050412907.1 dystroglycan 1 [Patella vulgata]XP_050412908.1 dystroglycan 1 [Patella vulgata]XP_050412909.1 dystroglycan 1 [Patella vulgata]XP_050412910.1 dystroglycan 1 [Patella vulgata]XP_050412912.1 dystroglycan 1 [Patella vulgata]XP_055958583.1 dystroglycan 1 [Patella vulgata]